VLYVVVHAGGGSFANGKRGDGIWMFSLDGKIGPIVAALPDDGGRKRRGVEGKGGGPTLIGKMDAGQIRVITTTDRNNMPTFREIYDVNQIRDVAKYITQQLAVMPKQVVLP
jgi:hypothetical protein